MYIETEGVVLKQSKILEDRRMLTLFTKKFGKINTGANHQSKGKTKSSLALRPFTQGKYELYKGKNTFNIQSTDVIRSFYKIGEDIDKYVAASFALELTDRILVESEPAPKIYEILLEFLEIMENRGKEYNTLVIAYQLKILKFSGSMPHTKNCVACGKSPDNGFVFDVVSGGIVCSECVKRNTRSPLIFEVNTGIIDIVNYIMVNSLHTLSKIRIEEKSLSTISEILKQYFKHHFGIDNLKSQSFLEI